ncbi:hypothetical protein [uncultured Aquimarina sp.]|uniref:hypothetical protein n=1 Tax=uncultured Aquimarina sp. TaxID=575652 RepID=UPI002614F146|nr:hypothetical protein [uncultured Aquimarina sp.]
MNDLGLFSSLELDENEITIKSSEVFLSKSFLIKRGFNPQTLDNYLSNHKKNRSDHYEFHIDQNTKEKWIRYNTIPKAKLRKLSLPPRISSANKLFNKDRTKIKYKEFSEIWLILYNAWNNQSYWKQYISYYSAYYLDIEKRNLFAKTHSVIAEAIHMKNNTDYKLKDIYQMYLKFDKVLFRTKSYNSFSRKLLLAEKSSIPETIIHKFKKDGRNNYRLIPLVEKRIIYYYSHPKRYSKKQITEKVNEELVDKGLKKISYNSVTLFLRNPEMKNKYDMLRYGMKYAQNKILPYLRRRDPENKGDVF